MKYIAVFTYTLPSHDTFSGFWDVSVEYNWLWTAIVGDFPGFPRFLGQATRKIIKKTFKITRNIK